jgi:hypothetical protein
MTSIRPAIAGIPIPDSRVTRKATESVRKVSSQLLFDHANAARDVLEGHGLP